MDARLEDALILILLNLVAWAFITDNLTREHCLGRSALRLDIDDEIGAHTLMAVHGHWSAHLLDDVLADRQPKASADLVTAFQILELAEVNEEVLEILRTDYDSLVPDSQL